MSSPELITSRQNPHVRALANLRERDARRERGVFLVEGFRELSRALEAEVAVTEIYFCPSLFKNARSQALLGDAEKRGVTLRELGESAFEKVSGREGADGLLGVAKMWDVALERVTLKVNPLLLVVESVEKPGNLGALLRTADSAGCDALICCDPVVDIFNPGVVRASQGALFSMPVAVASTGAVVDFLRERKISVFATTPAASTVYWESDFRGASAILLGSEKDGLSAAWLAQENVRKIAIPQAGLSDSLNVATAGAICLYEAVRQRCAR